MYCKMLYGITKRFAVVNIRQRLTMFAHKLSGTLLVEPLHRVSRWHDLERRCACRGENNTSVSGPFKRKGVSAMRMFAPGFL